MTLISMFRTGLDDLEQGLHGELDALIARQVVLVVLLKEFMHGPRGASDRVGFPGAEHAPGLDM